ncbi:MAG: hypothetical protein ACKVP7_05405 [Hyphomicrobiaceae bacterium]
MPIIGQAREPFRLLAETSLAVSAGNHHDLANILRDRFSSTYCVVRPDPDGNRLVLAAFGNGYAHLDEHWDNRKVGTPFGEFADPDYSAFVQQAYRDVWSSWRPTLERIDAPSFKPPLPSTYERLLLPIHWGNQRAMLSATLI